MMSLRLNFPQPAIVWAHFKKTLCRTSFEGMSLSLAILRILEMIGIPSVAW